jgi:hypothetical protein
VRKKNNGEGTGDLFEDRDGETPGDRDGETYEREIDYERLNTQAGDVWRAMMSGRWMTLAELERLTGHPQASISARLRDFRKTRFGAHRVERLRFERGLFIYRLMPYGYPAQGVEVDLNI